MNKRLLTIIIFFGIVLLAVILMFTVFTVKDVEIVISGDPGDLNENHIRASADIKKGGSIFAVSESRIVSNIESQRPYAKVTSVERKFPDKIVIRVAMRYPVMALTMDNDNIAVVDREMKVVEVLTSEDFAGRIGQRGDLEKIVRTNVSIENIKDVVAGMSLSEKSDDLIHLQNVIIGFENIGKVNSAFTAFVERVNIDYVDSQLDIFTSSGVRMEIDLKSYQNNIGSMIKLAYEWYVATNSSADPEINSRVTNGYIKFNESGGAGQGYSFVWYAEEA